MPSGVSPDYLVLWLSWPGSAAEPSVSLMPVKRVGLLSWKLKAAPVEREVDGSVVGYITSDMEDGCGV